MNHDFTVTDYIAEFSKLSPYSTISPSKITLVEETDSTNTQLLSLLNKTNSDKIPELEGTLMAALSQTAGRGRIGRKFYSPKSGIYFSYIKTNPDGITNPSLFTVTAAVGICRAIENLYPVKTQIKWVNDIYINDKKICGILTEGHFNFDRQLVDSVVVGCGINIEENNEIPDEIKNNVGSIVPDSNSVPIIRLLAHCINEIQKIHSTKENIIPEYKKRSNLLGKTLSVTPLVGTPETYSATAIDITENAELVVRLPDNSTRILNSGEVTLHKE